MPDQPPKKRRRWFQFSLRALLVLTLIAALPMGWLAWRLDRVRQQRDAVQWIEAAGGKASYDYQKGEIFAGQLNTPPGPACLRRVLGDDFFANVTTVRLQGIDASDADTLWQGALERLPALPNLETLLLDESDISDSQLMALASFPQLEILSLSFTPITDDSLALLPALHELQDIRLSSTKITDSGLSQLKRQIGLKKLWLGGNKITDAGIQQLGALHTLEYVNLNYTAVTADGIARLQAILPHARISWDGAPLRESEFILGL